MGNYISKKTLNTLKIRIFDNFDQFLAKNEGAYLDGNACDDLKNIVDNAIKAIQEDNFDTSDALGDRQFRVLEYLKKFNEITRREYSSMFGISFMTAFRDLTLMEKRKLLLKVGRGRATKYLLK